jgi:hypothetical protein
VVAIEMAMVAESVEINLVLGLQVLIVVCLQQKLVLLQSVVALVAFD